MIRVLAMSDTHRRHGRFTLPEADIFLHAGDFTNTGNGAEEFALWYWQLPYKNKFVILGNHENAHAVEKRSLDTWRRLFGPTLLQDQAVEVSVKDDKVVLYGAPYGTTQFSPASSAASLVLTHEPPFDILDRPSSGGRIGDARIADFVRKVAPRLHIFGHAHASGGRSHREADTLYVNAATRAMLVDFGAEANLVRVVPPR